MSAALAGALAGVAGSLLTLASLLIAEKIQDRLTDRRIKAIEDSKQRSAMILAMRRAREYPGASTAEAYRLAMVDLQADGDDRAALCAYVLWAGECELTGDTWTAVDERMAA